MKYLILVASLIIPACGSSVDNLANAINNASSTAQQSQTCNANSNSQSNESDCKNTSNSNQSSTPTTRVTVSNKTKVSAPAGSSVSVTNNTTIIVNGKPQETSEGLDGSSWESACNTGISYKISFARGIETLTTNLYEDDSCQIISHSVDQTSTYAVNGDDIQFGEGAAGVYVLGAPFQIISTDGNTLSFSGNEAQVYSRL